LQGQRRVLHRRKVGCKRAWMVLEKGFDEVASGRGGGRTECKSTDGGRGPGRGSVVWQEINRNRAGLARQAGRSLDSTRVEPVMPMRQTFGNRLLGRRRTRGGGGGRRASKVQTKVRVGGTSRGWHSGARCSPGGLLEMFPEEGEDGLRQVGVGLAGSLSADRRVQIRRYVVLVWSETETAGVVMKGNNEGEGGGIGIASRKTPAAGTGL
jgi:hypothetical protein